MKFYDNINITVSLKKLFFNILSLRKYENYIEIESYNFGADDELDIRIKLIFILLLHMCHDFNKLEK